MIAASCVPLKSENPKLLDKAVKRAALSMDRSFFIALEVLDIVFLVVAIIIILKSIFCINYSTFKLTKIWQEKFKWWAFFFKVPFLAFY
jgi:hypothetical protein